jgi:hypothetical protein
LAAAGVGLLLALFATVDVAFEGQLPAPAGRVRGLVLLAVVAGAGAGFRELIANGLVWWGRVLSLLLVAGSVWVLVSAWGYGECHRYPSESVTVLGELALLGGFIGAVGGSPGCG